MWTKKNNPLQNIEELGRTLQTLLRIQTLNKLVRAKKLLEEQQRMLQRTAEHDVARAEAESPSGGIGSGPRDGDGS